MQTSSTPLDTPHCYSPAELAIKLLREKARTKRRHLREKRRQAAEKVRSTSKAVGTAHYKASDKGFIKQHELPTHFKPLINGIRRWAYTQHQYIDTDGIVRSLSQRGHRKLFEVLIVLITSCDFMSGQVGKPTEIDMDTTKHDSFMLEHARRFGYSMSSTTWYRYINILKSMQIFSGREIKVWGKDGTVRSRGSYKWLSKDFLRRIGVFKDDIMKSIKLAYQTALDKGYSFVWRQHNAPIGYRPTHDLFSAYSPSTAPPQ